MDDYFALLGIPRHPRPDQEAVRAAFHRLSTTTHPDQEGGSEASFTLLNRAHQTLISPATCIRHFVALEFPNSTSISGNQVPAPLADLWFDLSAVNREVDTFLERKRGATTAIAKAVLAPEETELQERCESALARIDTIETETLATLDTEPHLTAAADALTYTTKWKAGLREQLVQLVLS